MQIGLSRNAADDLKPLSLENTIYPCEMSERLMQPDDDDELALTNTHLINWLGHALGPFNGKVTKPIVRTYVRTDRREVIHHGAG